MQDYPFNLNAGMSTRFSVTGDTVRYKTGDGAVLLRTNAGSVSLAPGQQITDRNGGFSEFSIKNESGGSISGVLVVGNFDFKDEQPVGVVLNGGSVPLIQNLIVPLNDIGSFAIAPNGKKLTIKSSIQNIGEVWISFSGNPVITPHLILAPGESFSESDLLIGPDGLAIYIAAPSSDVAVDVIYWV